jgi:ABC-type enterobactin transport system permease subunit
MKVGLLAAFGVATAVTIWNNGGINSHGWQDTLMFGVFIVLMVWLLSPRRSDKNAGHDSPTE